jgi:hypothetical protein
LHAQGIPGKGEHAPQLPGTHDSNAQWLQEARGSGLASTAAVCAARNASKAA